MSAWPVDGRLHADGEFRRTRPEGDDGEADDERRDSDGGGEAGGASDEQLCAGDQQHYAGDQKKEDGCIHGVIILKQVKKGSRRDAAERGVTH